MQPDEVRFAEDMEPLGFNWIKLGLQDVLYDPVRNIIYTPNTNKTTVISEEPDDTLQDDRESGIIEPRANPNHDSKGRFASSKGGKCKKTKYAPSSQRSKGGIQLGKKRYARMCGTLGTQYPGLKEGRVRTIRDAKHQYTVKADGYGGFKTLRIKNIE